MKTLEVADAVAPLAEYARNLKDEPMILTIGGRPVAALVAIGNVDLETAALSNNAQFLALIERSRTRHAVEGGISAEEIRQRLGI